MVERRSIFHIFSRWCTQPYSTKPYFKYGCFSEVTNSTNRKIHWHSSYISHLQRTKYSIVICPCDMIPTVSRTALVQLHTRNVCCFGRESIVWNAALKPFFLLHSRMEMLRQTAFRRKFSIAFDIAASIFLVFSAIVSASFCKLCNAPVWQRHLAKLASGGEQDGATAQRKDQVESLDAIGLLSWRQIQQWKQSE